MIFQGKRAGQSGLESVAGRAKELSMGDLLQPWHLLVVAVVAFLLFGARRLPELGKGLGEGLKGFKEGLKGINDPAPTPTAQQSTTPPPPQDGQKQS
jgi:sec-independent protein translocase protein TatA